jgi:hypothetical protein
MCRCSPKFENRAGRTHFICRNSYKTYNTVGFVPGGNIFHNFCTTQDETLTAQLQIASIVFIAIVVPMPMRWLAGTTHMLGHRNWFGRSMGQAVELIYDAFVEVESDGGLMHNEDYIMGIVAPLYHDLPELEEYLT